MKTITALNGKGITTVKVPHIGPRPRNGEIVINISKNGTTIAKK